MANTTAEFDAHSESIREGNRLRSLETQDDRELTEGAIARLAIESAINGAS